MLYSNAAILLTLEKNDKRKHSKAPLMFSMQYENTFLGDFLFE